MTGLPTRELTFNVSARVEQVHEPGITAQKMSINTRKSERDSLNLQAHQENVRLTKKPLWAFIIAAFAKILALELQQVGQKLLTTL
jgi:hypothetical protein